MDNLSSPMVTCNMRQNRTGLGRMEVAYENPFLFSEVAVRDTSSWYQWSQLFVVPVEPAIAV